MSEIKALEDLRKWAQRVIESCCMGMKADEVLESADEIQAEVDERFMELPVDADGVPIHVGDELEGGYCVDYVAPHWVLSASRGVKHDGSCHHVNPRTLEDVLNDFGRKFAENYHYPNADDLVDKTADEIRELMKEGGE